MSGRRIAEPGLTYDEVMTETGRVLNGDVLLMVDTSLAHYAAGRLKVTGTDAFISNDIWQSIGFSTPASLGVALAGRRRPLVLTGDGGFQSTVQSVSTLARYKVPAIIVVLDNGIYAIEQQILDPAYFRNATTRPRPTLELQKWDYAAIARAMGVAFAKTAVRRRSCRR